MPKIIKSSICEGCFFDNFMSDHACVMKIKVAAQGGHECILKAPVSMVKTASSDDFEVRYPTAKGTVVFRRENGKETRELI